MSKDIPLRFSCIGMFHKIQAMPADGGMREAKEVMYALNFTYCGQVYEWNIQFANWVNVNFADEVLLHHVGYYIVNRLRKDNIFQDNNFPSNIVVKDASGIVVVEDNGIDLELNNNRILQILKEAE